MGSQRNGVAGHGFYSFIIDFTEDGRKRLITVASMQFYSNNEWIEELDKVNAFVINPADIEDKFRGDEIALDLNKGLSQLMMKHELSELHDCIGTINKMKNGYTFYA